MPPEVDVPEKSVLAAYRNRLGKVPDQKIADLAQVSRTLVVNYRKKLGIPAYQGHKGTPPAVKAEAEPAASRSFRGRRSALDPYLGRLGHVSDAEIAKLAGVTAENVRTYRQRRQIAPAWQADEAPPEARTAAPPLKPVAVVAPKPVVLEPVVAAPAATPRSAKKPRPAEVDAPTGVASVAAVATAFLVMVETAQGPQSYAIIAEDIAAAAALAATRVSSRHPDGTIRAIQRVAELLPA